MKYPNLRKSRVLYRGQKRLLIALGCVMVLASSLGMLLPYFVSKRLVGITDGSFQKVLTATIGVMITVTLHHIFWYLWEKLATVLNEKVASAIRQTVLSRLMDMRYTSVTKNNSGFFLERMNDDALSVASCLSDLMGTVTDTLTNVGFLVLIYALNWKCALLFTLGTLVLYSIDLLRIQKDLQYTEKIKLLQEKMDADVTQTVRGIAEIKGLGVKDAIADRAKQTIEALAEAQTQKTSVTALLSRCKTWSQNALEGGIILFSVGVLLPKGEITAVMLLMILNYTGFMYDLVGFVANMKEKLAQSELKARRLFEILENTDADAFGNAENPPERFDITVSHLSYAYEGGENVLRDVSLSLPEHSLNALVGASGSGKSTLFGILTKLLPVESGIVSIGGRDINEFSEKALRNTICVIGQEPFLLNATVLDNIRLVKPDATWEDIEIACQNAGILDEILATDKGLDTMVLENGRNFSGGQKMRIAIVRAYLKNAPILLFDEPTSALDKENMRKFYQTLQRLKAEKTILVITHKLDGALGVDSVYQL